MIKVPKMTDADMAFGNVKHLPPWNEIPDEFKNSDNIYCRVQTHWFFKGLSKEKLDCLKPRDGVDKQKALRALGAIQRSFAPKHEHKEAGVAYLMSEWFMIEGWVKENV